MNAEERKEEGREMAKRDSRWTKTERVDARRGETRREERKRQEGKETEREGDAEITI